MLNFQDTFKTRKRSFISALSTCMTVPLNSFKCSKSSISRKNSVTNEKMHGFHIAIVK